MDAKLQDRQLKYVLAKYIIPNKGLDFNEIRTQEEFNDIQEGLKNIIIFLKKNIWNYPFQYIMVLMSYNKKADSIKSRTLIFYLNEPQLLTRFPLLVSPLAI